MVRGFKSAPERSSVVVVAEELHQSQQDLPNEHDSQVMFTVSGPDVFSVLDPVFVLGGDLSGSALAVSTHPDETGHVTINEGQLTPVNMDPAADHTGSRSVAQDTDVWSP